VNSVSQDQTAASSAPDSAVAFFDLDGTLVRGHTQVLLVKFMRRSGAVSWGYQLGAMVWFLAYKLRLVRLTRQAREKGAAMFRGLTEAEAEEAMARFAEEVLAPRLNGQVVSALLAHKARGHKVVILSAALEPVVKALSRRVGSDEYVGAECELARGRYTGRIRGAIPHSNEKTRVAAGFISRVGAQVEDCWAYGDHETDLSLLRWVGHPVAVNPRPRLLLVAQRAGWPILL
jgi:HAD superfamily hydrolase (TIGR01490 family)